MVAVQPTFAFPSLDFQNRSTLAVHEVAAKLRVTPQHVINLITSGALPEEAGQGVKSRARMRVRTEGYRQLITARTIGRPEFVAPASFSLGSMDFPTTAPLTFDEVARMVLCSTEHLAHLVFHGELCAIDIRKEGAVRACWRVPIEAYRHFVSVRKTKPN